MPTPTTPLADWGDDQRQLTPSVSVLIGAAGGRYPTANSLLVAGSSETVLIDPSITVVDRGGAPVAVDAVLNSHCHEDHMAGNGMFRDVRLHIHDRDLVGARSIDGLLAGYGLDPDAASLFRTQLIEEFHYAPRPDAVGFHDGDVFDLGSTTVEVIHLPGHTAGHSGFGIGNVCYLADIDLTGFGPYYGDMWSSLTEFEASLDTVRQLDAHWYVTSHHKGVIEGRAQFIELLDAFAAVITRRHDEMLAFLATPHSIHDMVQRRFVYRPHITHPFADAVERRSATLHIDQMLARGEVTEVAPETFVAR